MEIDENKVKNVFARGRELISREAGEMIVSQQQGMWVVSWIASGGATWCPLAVARDKELSRALDKLAAQLSDHPNREAL